ncbi:MAG: TonB-dependent receptor [Gammaproteobacteria bacterium]|nr:TonB-dependent receptor [Gammaproteobacteria bacterium]
MNRFNEHPGLTWQKPGFAWLLSMIAGVALSIGVATAQEEAGDAEEEEALELADVRVTGSRLNRPPSELSGNLIVLDREDIRATGELTLARVLRQLPQNVNATNETYGSTLNGARNVTGAATVNLRGLGSESSLILIDGRRVGYSGILGGVTDISTIPLSMVDRIEILLDGASAVYGSDAVGGVVNIITRRDYSGLEFDVNYGRPHKSGYSESQANIGGGFSWGSGRLNAGYEYFRDSGLDASDRDSIVVSNRSTLQNTNQKNTAAGPRIRVYTNFFDDTCNSDAPVWDRRRAVIYEQGGRIITRDEYAALEAEQQAMATCVNDFTLPAGFQHTDSLSALDIVGEPHWGEEAELGRSLRPEIQRHSIFLGVDQELTGSLVLHGNIRATTRDAEQQDGLIGVGGTLHANSPFNPFGTQVSLTGVSTASPPRMYDSTTDDLYVGLGIEGMFGGWSWQADFSSSSSEQDTQRLNVRDPAYGLGVNSDGVSEAVIGRFSRILEPACADKVAELGGTRYQYSSFFGGNCTVYGAPPDPINPFGDISQYVLPDVYSGGKNEQLQFEALARGELFSAPGGAIALVVGYDYRQDTLDSFNDLANYLSSNTATGSANYNTQISRDNHAAFIEGLIPLVGSDNAMAGVQRLNLTFSGRYDSYSNVDVDYRQTESAPAESIEAKDPGSEFTWSGGIVYRPTNTALFKANFGTSFVAPQLNQLLSKSLYEGNPRTLFHYVPPENRAIRSLPSSKVFGYSGGNEQLKSETAETVSFTAEFSPDFLPGVLLKASWSDTDFEDRIYKLPVPVIHLDDLPSNVMYIESEDIYVIDDRWINVSAIERSGVDYELGYEWEMGLNDYKITVRRSYVNKYRVQVDPASGIVHSLVTTRDDSGPEDSVIPPVPKHKTTAQFTWSRGSLFMSIDVEGSDETRRISNGGVFTYIDEPATLYDLVLGYGFDDNTLFSSPDWLDGVELTLTINNLTNAFPKYTRIAESSGERTTNAINPLTEWTQGRSYRLNVHKSF